MENGLTGLMQWAVQWVQYYGIPFAVTFNLVAYFFQTVPAGGQTGGKQNDSGMSWGGFFKYALTVIAIGITAFVLIGLAMDYIPALGAQVQSEAGF